MVAVQRYLDEEEATNDPNADQNVSAWRLAARQPGVVFQFLSRLSWKGRG